MSGSVRLKAIRAAALAASGKSQAEIAAELGVTDRQVRRLLSKPEAVATLEEAQEAVRSLFAHYAEDIGEELARIALEAHEEKDRIAAGRVVLDRIGVVGGSKIEHSDASDAGPADVSADEAKAELRVLRGGRKE